MAINSINSLSQAFKAMPTQVNAAKNNSVAITGNSVHQNNTENFSKIMENALNAVDVANKSAQDSATSFLTQEAEYLHSMVLAAEKADIALQMTMQIRNKAIDAYQEVMRMQI